jgi:hypothetical protein
MQVYLIIALMMEAVCTSETPVYYYETTLRYIPEGSNLQVQLSLRKDEHMVTRRIPMQQL